VHGSGGLRVLHVLRAPVGGLFRHVRDLVGAQAGRGHLVGVVAADSGGGPLADAAFAELEAVAALGVTRVPMARQIGPSDLPATRHVMRRVADARVQIVHGHGAKGGAYARLAAALARGHKPAALYTPHGGSLHYSRTSPAGFAFLALERALTRATDGAIFESAYAKDAFRAKVGRLPGLVRVVHNGLRPEEFQPVVPAADATDLLFVGELRHLKGVDLLLEAVGDLSRGSFRPTLTVVGAGPDASSFQALAASLGLADQVRFLPPMPARQAFSLGRVLAVPSRAESLPYIVLEGVAAGLLVVATDVGGIPEIFGADRSALVPPGEAAPLAAALGRTLGDPAAAQALAGRLSMRVASAFSLDAMVDGVMEVYAAALGEQPARAAVLGHRL